VRGLHGAQPIHKEHPYVRVEDRHPVSLHVVAGPRPAPLYQASTGFQEVRDA